MPKCTCPNKECEIHGTPPDPQHGREQEWICSRCGHKNAANNEVCMGAEMGDGRCGKPKPNKVKSLAQYLAEYLEHEGDILPANIGDSKAVLEQALDAYQSTENVTIKIERV